MGACISSSGKARQAYKVDSSLSDNSLHATGNGVHRDQASNPAALVTSTAKTPWLNSQRHRGVIPDGQESPVVLPASRPGASGGVYNSTQDTDDILGLAPTSESQADGDFLSKGAAWNGASSNPANDARADAQPLADPADDSSCTESVKQLARAQRGVRGSIATGTAWPAVGGPDGMSRGTSRKPGGAADEDSTTVWEEGEHGSGDASVGGKGSAEQERVVPLRSQADEVGMREESMDSTTGAEARAGAAGGAVGAGVVGATSIRGELRSTSSAIGTEGHRQESSPLDDAEGLPGTPQRTSPTARRLSAFDSRRLALLAAAAEGGGGGGGNSSFGCRPPGSEPSNSQPLPSRMSGGMAAAEGQQRGDSSLSSHAGSQAASAAGLSGQGGGYMRGGSWEARGMAGGGGQRLQSPESNTDMGYYGEDGRYSTPTPVHGAMPVRHSMLENPLLRQQLGEQHLNGHADAVSKPAVLDYVPTPKAQMYGRGHLLLAQPSRPSLLLPQTSRPSLLVQPSQKSRSSQQPHHHLLVDAAADPPEERCDSSRRLEYVPAKSFTRRALTTHGTTTPMAAARGGTGSGMLGISSPSRPLSPAAPPRPLPPPSPAGSTSLWPPAAAAATGSITGRPPNPFRGGGSSGSSDPVATSGGSILGAAGGPLQALQQQQQPQQQQPMDAATSFGRAYPRASSQPPYITAAPSPLRPTASSEASSDWRRRAEAAAAAASVDARPSAPASLMQPYQQQPQSPLGAGSSSRPNDTGWGGRTTPQAGQAGPSELRAGSVLSGTHSSSGLALGSSSAGVSGVAVNSGGGRAADRAARLLASLQRLEGSVAVPAR
ncbi:hypothetical protein Agub_g10278 [Astrephomene gubernaculifera]|uniref:Uncharacterized protein n=1 Tax=Astrephomene gubernaculifera TaxID=47775 RepID=A0AAD3DUS8_9CHLO|nr:hypothetical protein Agub_g10278 [Astrephomene gubernaculifera]